MISIGFTGTRHGMSELQQQAAVALIDEIAPPAVFYAHHGDCIGADKQFHDACRSTNGRAYVVVHPGPDGARGWRAGCLGDERRDPAPHMWRNATIVAASTVMLAAPAEMTEQQRGGTWATIRMARKAGKPLAIVFPDGRVEKERWV